MRAFAILVERLRNDVGRIERAGVRRIEAVVDARRDVDGGLQQRMIRRIGDLIAVDVGQAAVFQRLLVLRRRSSSAWLRSPRSRRPSLLQPTMSRQRDVRCKLAVCHRSEVPMRRSFQSIGCAAILLLAPFAPAQEHEHSHDQSETLGEVHFPTSCRGVEAEFTRAIGAAAFVRLRGSAPRVRSGGGKRSNVRDGVLGHRDDVVSPDLGAAECAGTRGGNGCRNASRSAFGGHRARAWLHRRDERVLSRRRPARSPSRARRHTATR